MSKKHGLRHLTVLFLMALFMLPTVNAFAQQTVSIYTGHYVIQNGKKALPEVCRGLVNPNPASGWYDPIYCQPSPLYDAYLVKYGLSIPTNWPSQNNIMQVAVFYRGFWHGTLSIVSPRSAYSDTVNPTQNVLAIPSSSFVHIHQDGSPVMGIPVDVKKDGQSILTQWNFTPYYGSLPNPGGVKVSTNGAGMVEYAIPTDKQYAQFTFDYKGWPHKTSSFSTATPVNANWRWLVLGADSEGDYVIQSGQRLLVTATPTSSNSQQYDTKIQNDSIVLSQLQKSPEHIYNNSSMRIAEKSIDIQLLNDTNNNYVLSDAVGHLIPEILSVEESDKLSQQNQKYIQPGIYEQDEADEVNDYFDFDEDYLEFFFNPFEYIMKNYNDFMSNTTN